MGFWLSDVERLRDDDDEWGFSALGNKDVSPAIFAFHNEEATEIARLAMVPAARDFVLIAAEES